MKAPRPPNFLIAGAARSGTTALYHLLAQHPDVYLPENKRPEPHFFLKSSEYRRGLDYYLDRYFAAAKSQTAVGEASTSYLYQPYVPERIAATYPHMKLVVLLRDPVERAHSNYRRSVESGLEKLDFDTAVRTEDDRLRALSGEMAEIAPYAYAGRSLYHSQLKRYLEWFPPEQMLILFSDELEDAPEALAARVFSFLGVDSSFAVQVSKTRLNAAVPAGDAIAAGTRDYLRRLFAGDISQLEELTGRSLATWRDR